MRLPYLVLMLVGLVLVGCERKRSYSQATPDTTVQSAVRMVREGEADRLVELIYADTPEMRYTLDRIGVLLGHMGELANAVADEFPDEVDAARKAGTTGTPSMFSALQITVGEAQRGGGDRGELQERIGGVLADPYGWLDASADRLSTMRLNDDTAAILFDDKQIIPPIGLPMRLVDGEWYVAPPVHMAARWMPANDDQWAIINSVIKVLDRTVVETTVQVRSGEVSDLKLLGDKTVEKLMIPGGIAFGAYAKEMEVREETADEKREFNKRLRTWRKARRDRDGDEAVSKRVMAAAQRVAGVQMEAGVRYGDRVKVEGMTDVGFEDLLGRWFGVHGLELDLGGPVTGAAVDARIEAWEAGVGAELEVPRPRRSRQGERLRWFPDK